MVMFLYSETTVTDIRTLLVRKLGIEAGYCVLPAEDPYGYELLTVLSCVGKLMERKSISHLAH